jgi:hypothetical protein
VTNGRVAAASVVAGALLAGGLVGALTFGGDDPKRQAGAPATVTVTVTEPGTTSQGATTTSPNTAAGSEQLLFDSDNERPMGFAGLGPWTGQQCRPWISARDIVRGTVERTDDQASQGRWARRFDLPAELSGPTSCESVQERLIGLGTTDYYAVSFRLPTDWREPSPDGWGLVLAQFNYQGIYGPSVGLTAHADRVRLTLGSGLCRPVGTPSPPGPACQWTNGYGADPESVGANVRDLVVIKPLRSGTWYEVIVRVTWATDDGVVEGWSRRSGQSEWAKSAELRDKPTVQWTAERGTDVIHFSGTVDKAGAYRGKSAEPVSVWHDVFARARSFDAAEAAFE